MFCDKFLKVLFALPTDDLKLTVTILQRSTCRFCSLAVWSAIFGNCRLKSNAKLRKILNWNCAFWDVHSNGGGGLLCKSWGRVRVKNYVKQTISSAVNTDRWSSLHNLMCARAIHCKQAHCNHNEGEREGDVRRIRGPRPSVAASHYRPRPEQQR